MLSGSGAEGITFFVSESLLRNQKNSFLYIPAGKEYFTHQTGAVGPIHLVNKTRFYH